MIASCLLATFGMHSSREAASASAERTLGASSALQVARSIFGPFPKLSRALVVRILAARSGRSPSVLRLNLGRARLFACKTPPRAAMRRRPALSGGGRTRPRPRPTGGTWLLRAGPDVRSGCRWLQLRGVAWRVRAMRKCWKQNVQISPSNPDHSPVSAPLREVFHLD